MERVAVLIDRLKEQLELGCDANILMVTTHMLQRELLSQLQGNDEGTSGKVAVVAPFSFNIYGKGMERHAQTAPASTYKPAPVVAPVSTPIEHHEPAPQKELEPAVEEVPQPVMEAVTEPESVMEVAEEPASQSVLASEPTPLSTPAPEPIPHFEEEKPWQRLFVNNEEKETPWNMDPMLEFPTLAHQEKIVFELNDVMMTDTATSLNEVLKQESEEVVTKLHDVPVKDLKKAISINERHQFVQELFKNDEAMYERSIKTINGFRIYAEAEYWIQRELKIKIGWDNSDELVKAFDQVVKRRFS